MNFIRLCLLSSVSHTSLAEAGNVVLPTFGPTFDSTTVTFDTDTVTWDAL